MYAKSFLRQLTPPILWEAGSHIVKRPYVEFEGPLLSWPEAAARAAGWNRATDEIALSAAQKVIDGLAVAERDGIALDSTHHSTTVLAFLAMLAARHHAVRVIDFGGGLGSNYYQGRTVLSALGLPVSWTVIERPSLAAIGREKFQTEELQFSETIEAVSKICAGLIFTGSLQYVPDPFDTTSPMLDDIEIVALDRVLVSNDSEHAVFVQHPPSWHPWRDHSFPVWRFSRGRLMEWFKARGFKIIEEFSIPSRPETGLLFLRSK
jgi:putative methyltransferase (TIGR04325 family)